jgi:hypothetical protein
MKIILYLIFLIILLIASLSFKEGFESGQYGYLAPNVILVTDETTKNNFITAAKKTGAVFFPEITFTEERINQIKNEMNKTKEISLDEINYYIQNNKWPYNSYISNYLTRNKDSILDKIKHTKIKSSDDLQKVIPTRLFYKYFIESTETQISPPPLSNDIYMGKAVAPADTPTPVEPTATIRPPFSSDNYTKLQSICSTLK